MASFQMTAVKRLYKEMQTFENSDSLRLVQPEPDDISLFYIDIKVPNNPLYPPEDTYRLMYKPGPSYPFEPPQVRFVTFDHYSNRHFPVPVSPHMYSNGHICLNILYDAWSPVNTIHSVGLSIQSMLAGNKTNRRPPDDQNYCSHAPENPLETKWVFEDDKV